MPDREDRRAAAARPFWRLPEPVRELGPPGMAWKLLLAAAVVVQAVWIIALLMMAKR